MSKPRWKPCPWCALTKHLDHVLFHRDVHTDHPGFNFCVRCRVCKIDGRRMPTKSAATRWWNARKKPKARRAA